MKLNSRLCLFIADDAAGNGPAKTPAAAPAAPETKVVTCGPDGKPIPINLTASPTPPTYTQPQAPAPEPTLAIDLLKAIETVKNLIEGIRAIPKPTGQLQIAIGALAKGVEFLGHHINLVTPPAAAPGAPAAPEPEKIATLDAKGKLVDLPPGTPAAS